MARMATLLAVSAACFHAFAGAGPALAACEAGGLLNTCLDEPFSPGAGAEENYQRLDGGSYGGRPMDETKQKTITIGDTTVTLGQTEETAQPWNAFNQKTAEETLPREDRPRGTDPLKTQCYADGCY
ncbi:hypothetical protein Plav_0487 [Parvibaculum lavamentivorans DS-1]|uniref:Uncharacterized protein n=1 Tax=Parvibaculum lavamentivorans (strain DS-1 / DSM 13023 / NCIMB 13966) TaxID=402881 RepID=A7HQC7_PARL1|nr:hypothetical protein [Parvibaculum lavamentivorans]ABS62110.1 hypothetical protein Plav_0487 [Parvibaculum lavamentivorans DS-1]